MRHQKQEAIGSFGYLIFGSKLQVIKMDKILEVQFMNIICPSELHLFMTDKVGLNILDYFLMSVIEIYIFTSSF